MFKPGGNKEYVYGRGVPTPGDRFWVKNTGKIPELDYDNFDPEADRADELLELTWTWLAYHSMHGQIG